MHSNIVSEMILLSSKEKYFKKIFSGSFSLDPNSGPPQNLIQPFNHITTLYYHITTLPNKRKK